MADTTLNASAFCICSTKANIPQLDRQATRCGASTTASLGKQRSQFLGKAPAFQGDSHTLYGPIAGLVTDWDTFISSVSWTGAGGQDESVEIQNAQGQPIFRATAQAMSGPNFSCIPVGRLAVGGYRVPVLDSGVLLVTLGRRPRNV